MPDEGALAELREYPNWPPRLEALAVQAAALGHLKDAAEKARAQTFRDAISHVVPTAPIPAARKPISVYRASEHWEATFYRHLERELRTVLGLPINLASDSG